jgi:hypothetical protein
MLIKKRDLLKIEFVIQKYSKIKGFKFPYTLHQNYLKIKPEIEAFSESIKPSEEFNAYLKDIDAAGCIIQCKHCGKDNVSPTPELLNKHKIVIADRIKAIKEYEKELDTTVNIEFEILDIKYVEENLSEYVNFEFLKDLSFMIGK